MISDLTPGRTVFYFSHQYKSWNPGPGTIIRPGKPGRVVVRFERFPRARSVSVKSLYKNKELESD